jgi:hypothetical protein
VHECLGGGRIRWRLNAHDDSVDSVQQFGVKAAGQVDDGGPGLNAAARAAAGGDDLVPVAGEQVHYAAPGPAGAADNQVHDYLPGKRAAIAEEAPGRAVVWKGGGPHGAGRSVGDRTAARAAHVGGDPAGETALTPW